MKYDAPYWINRVNQQKKWIAECGETLDGYINRMPSRSLEDVKAIFDADQSELTRLEIEVTKTKPVVSSTEQEQQLATMIHDVMCHWNHTDGCGWHYESWDKPSWDRNKYLKKAKAVLAVVPFEQACQAVKALKG